MSLCIRYGTAATSNGINAKKANLTIEIILGIEVINVNDINTNNDTDNNTEIIRVTAAA